MDHFIIDGFDFGIDATRTHVKPTAEGADIVVVGDNRIIDKLIDDESSPWNWLIQPPMLYLRNFQFSPCSAIEFRRELTDDDLDDFDIALYIMEHCDTLPCLIALDSGLFTAVGDVHGIKKSPVAFDVRFTLPSA